MPISQKKALFSAFIICQSDKFIQSYLEVTPASKPYSSCFDARLKLLFHSTFFSTIFLLKFLICINKFPMIPTSPVDYHRKFMFDYCLSFVSELLIFIFNISFSFCLYIMNWQKSYIIINTLIITSNTPGLESLQL